VDRLDLRRALRRRAGRQHRPPGRLLVPAVMRLAGNANWWAPRPLRRIHQRIALRE
jgi:hypothetical protein